MLVGGITFSTGEEGAVSAEGEEAISFGSGGGAILFGAIDDNTVLASTSFPHTGHLTSLRHCDSSTSNEHLQLVHLTFISTSFSFDYVQNLLMTNNASCLSCALRAQNLSGLHPQCRAPLRALALGYGCRALRALAAFAASAPFSLLSSTNSAHYLSIMHEHRHTLLHTLSSDSCPCE